MYWGGGTDEAYTCNIFVGECIYLYKGATVAMNGSKYNSANDVFTGRASQITEVKKEKTMPGDIAAFNGVHVEIITSVQRADLIGNINFCSRGGGRSYDNGIEKCGSWYDIDNMQRDLANSYIKIFRVQ